MATKKIRELGFDDLGKKVRLVDPDGDVNSGELQSISFRAMGNSLSIGGTRVGSLDVEREIEFLED